MKTLQPIFLLFGFITAFGVQAQDTTVTTPTDISCTQLFFRRTLRGPVSWRVHEVLKSSPIFYNSSVTIGNGLPVDSIQKLAIAIVLLNSQAGTLAAIEDYLTTAFTTTVRSNDDAKIIFQNLLRLGEGVHVAYQRGPGARLFATVFMRHEDTRFTIDNILLTDWIRAMFAERAHGIVDPLVLGIVIAGIENPELRGVAAIPPTAFNSN